MAFNDVISTGDVTLVQLMLDYGADATSGLQTAIAKDQIHMIQTLIQYGADPNAGVHLAKSILNEDALILLDEYGATVENIPREQLYPEDYVEATIDFQRNVRSKISCQSTDTLRDFRNITK